MKIGEIMSQGFFKKVFGDKKNLEGFENYLDLGKEVKEEREKKQADMFVKVAEIREIDDATRVKEEIYDGNIVVMNISAIKDEDVLKDRIINEIKRATADVGGDVAGLGNRQIIATPSRVKVNRKKIGGGDFR